MTDIYITNFELLAATRDAKNYSAFRDYDAELKFIGMMEDFEIYSHIKGTFGPILVFGERCKLIGMNVFFHGDADNEQ